MFVSTRFAEPDSIPVYRRRPSQQLQLCDTVTRGQRDGNQHSMPNGGEYRHCASPVRQPFVASSRSATFATSAAIFNQARSLFFTVTSQPHWSIFG